VKCCSAYKINQRKLTKQFNVHLSLLLKVSMLAGCRFANIETCRVNVAVYALVPMPTAIAYYRNTHCPQAEDTLPLLLA